MKKVKIYFLPMLFVLFTCLGFRYDCDPMAAPSELVANRTSAFVIALTWVDNDSYPTKFQIEQKVNDGAWELIATTKLNISTILVRATQNGDTYCYRVRAVNGACFSEYSNTYCTE